MFSIDCGSCPAPVGGCAGCLVDLLSAEDSQVTAGYSESCGYWIADDVKGAIEVLRTAGLVTDIEIIDGRAVA